MIESTTQGDLRNQLTDILRNTFGFQDFRNGQFEAISTLLTKGRALCILPTGHGKSLLYQLPACLLGGLTIVISPLLALMRDQIDHLNKRFNIPAVAINSDQTDEENDFARDVAARGMARVLFVAPEQLDHVDRFQFLLNLNVNLVVVDEAHCISTWGHDFRPSYRQILQFVYALHEKNPQIKILGLTATANKRVETDIKRQLSISGQDVVVLRESMNRPNISLSVIKVKGTASKLAACKQLITNLEGCGLIYCATRENTELVSDYLKKEGLSVAFYHAGIDSEEKRILQKDFINDKYKALVATNALGMGIDKGNLRFIIHFDFPGSITAYYQEVGRCGRDGEKAKGIILYDQKDREIQEYFIQSALPTPEDFQKVLNAVVEAPKPNLTSIKSLTGLHPTRVTTVVAELLEQNFLQKTSQSGTQIYQVIPNSTKPNLERYSNQLEVKMGELNQMLNYSGQTEDCRMAILRETLGESEVNSCKHCDCCQGTVETASFSSRELAEISHWLDERPVVIAPNKLQKVSAGISLLDSKMRSPQFIHFMKQRATCKDESLGLDEELLTLIKMHLHRLATTHRIGCLVPIPSRTWISRDPIAALLAKEIGVPSMSNLLFWSELPLKRQGELLNNDQRHQNVHKTMDMRRSERNAPGVILLFDDYIGSGNTLKEAARAMRTAGVTNEIMPFTIATVKWHLGKTGYL